MRRCDRDKREASTRPGRPVAAGGCATGGRRLGATATRTPRGSGGRCVVDVVRTRGARHQLKALAEVNGIRVRAADLDVARHEDNERVRARSRLDVDLDHVVSHLAARLRRARRVVSSRGEGVRARRGRATRLQLPDDRLGAGMLLALEGQRGLGLLPEPRARAWRLSLRARRASAGARTHIETGEAIGVGVERLVVVLDERVPNFVGTHGGKIRPTRASIFGMQVLLGEWLSKTGSCEAPLSARFPPRGGHVRNGGVGRRPHDGPQVRGAQSFCERGGLGPDEPVLRCSSSTCRSRRSARASASARRPTSRSRRTIRRASSSGAARGNDPKYSNAEFQYKHDTQEDQSFHLVDTAKANSAKRFGVNLRRPWQNRGRGRWGDRGRGGGRDGRGRGGDGWRRKGGFGAAGPGAGAGTTRARGGRGGRAAAAGATGGPTTAALGPAGLGQDHGRLERESAAGRAGEGWG